MSRMMPDATDDEHDEYDAECPNCGGEGVIYDCFDGFCIDAEDGCDDCAFPCDWCQGKGARA